MQRRTFLAASTAMAATTALPAFAAAAGGPLTTPWTGPYGGVPPFDKVRVADFKPGMEASMADELAEVDKITANPAPPSFENTIAALERTGRASERVGLMYSIWSGTLSTPEVRAVET